MKNENTEKIRERTLSLIESGFESDAAFERELGLAEKTVNNWRRGRSASFMKMLPVLSEKFGVNVGELLDMPLKGESSELSEDELRLLNIYRKSRILPEKLRAALRDNLENTVRLYISAVEESSAKKTRKKK